MLSSQRIHSPSCYYCLKYMCIKEISLWRLTWHYKLASLPHPNDCWQSCSLHIYQGRNPLMLNFHMITCENCVYLLKSTQILICTYLIFLKDRHNFHMKWSRGSSWEDLFSMYHYSPNQFPWSTQILWFLWYMNLWIRGHKIRL